MCKTAPVKSVKSATGALNKGKVPSKELQTLVLWRYNNGFWFFHQVKISKEVKQLLNSRPEERTSNQLQTVT